MATENEKPVVEMIQANQNNYGSRGQSKVNGVILHATQISREETIRHFQDETARASCHYLVAKDGTIIQFVRDEANAWHCGNSKFNRMTLGIEIEAIVKDQHNRWMNPPDGFTEPQYQSLLRLCRYIVGKYGVKCVRSGRFDPWPVGFKGHEDVPDPNDKHKFGGANHHTDPGPFFPWWGRLLQDLNNPLPVS